MAQEMIRRRHLRKMSRQILDKIFPLFPGSQDRILRMRMQVDDEPTEHKKILQWIKKTHHNLKHVEQYISSSNDNAYRFIPYYDPMFIRQETIPFQQFLRDLPSMPTAQIEQDQILNEQNAREVRETLHKLRQILQEIVQTQSVPQQPSFPMIRRLRRRRTDSIVIKPDIKHQEEIKQQTVTRKQKKPTVSIQREKQKKKKPL